MSWVQERYTLRDRAPRRSLLLSVPCSVTTDKCYPSLIPGGSALGDWFPTVTSLPLSRSSLLLHPYELLRLIHHSPLSMAKIYCLGAVKDSRSSDGKLLLVPYVIDPCRSSNLSLRNGYLGQSFSTINIASFYSQAFNARILWVYTNLENLLYVANFLTPTLGAMTYSLVSSSTALCPGPVIEPVVHMDSFTNAMERLYSTHEFSSPPTVHPSTYIRNSSQSLRLTVIGMVSTF
ncbi:hypothetical protein BDQ17DRAFT_397592 [Cyathus striatus]|nr:hypothetical protein BDQ17DRAFT_397592 [Cyathus striatus]